MDTPLQITLRTFTISDADDLLSWWDDRVTCNLRWNSLASKDETLSFIKKRMHPSPLATIHLPQRRSVGFVSIFQESGENNFKAYIRYGVSAEYWDRGVATQSMKLAAAQVFKDLNNLVRLQAHASVDNFGSQRVLEKTEFTKEGVLRKYEVIKGKIRDLVVYSFLPTDCLPVDVAHD